MTQPLTVDTSLLRSAGVTLQGLVVPGPPAPIIAAGSDSITTAINETMPIVESPVLEGLPIAGAVLAKTSSSIITAADMYAQTDRSWGTTLARQEFNAVGEQIAGRATGATAFARPVDSSSDEPPQGTPPEKPMDGVVPDRPGDHGRVPGSVTAVTPQINQMVGSVSSLAQSIASSAQGAPQNQPLGDQKDDETEGTDTGEQPGEPNDGAAGGGQTLGSAPTERGVDTSGGQPSADPLTPERSVV